MKKTRQLLISLFLALAVTLVAASGVLLRLDKLAQDALFQHPGVTSSDIVLIGIDDEAFDAFGPYHTWTRSIMAGALEALAKDPENLPTVVAVDVLYIGTSTEEADARLAEAAGKLGCVVTASMAVFGESVSWEDGRPSAIRSSAVVGYEEPYEALREATVQGHINAMYDRDGILRHALLYVEPEGERVLSMACQTAAAFLEKKGKTLELPEGEANIYVPFTGKPGDYSDGVSIANLLYGEVPAQYWKDKIVLIGPYAAALQDAYYTPIDKGNPMYGVEFQANVIQALIEEKGKNDLPDFPQLLLVFVLCAAAAFLFLNLRLIWGGVICLVLMALGLAVPYALYQAGHVSHLLWLSPGILAIYILSLAAHYVKASRERKALALEKERMKAELALAARIQTDSLPQEYPPFPERGEFDIYASMTPAKEVGGDLYDFFMVDDDHLALVIGDVSGKGVPAALFMMVATTLIRHAVMSTNDPAEALRVANNQICMRNPSEMFVSAWVGVLEISTGKLTMANAGHEYPALQNPGGSFALLKGKHGLVVGGMEGLRYRNEVILLQPGSKLFVYTDGLPEASNRREEFFRTERMLESLHSCEKGSAAEIVDSVKQAVEQFTGNADRFDDLTMLCLQYNGVGQTV